MVQLTAEALIGSLTITQAEAVEDYQGDYAIPKANLFNPSVPFLVFGYNGVMLPAVLNSQDSDNFYYTIRIPFLAVGDNEILIYSANSDNSNKELTFHEYYNFKNGFPNGWQSGYNRVLQNESDFNSIIWAPAGSQPTTDGWIKDANTDYIRHQSEYGILITNDLTTNQEAEGYTYEFIAEFTARTTWSFGFGRSIAFNSDSIRTSNNFGNTLYLKKGTTEVKQSIPVVADVFSKIKFAMSIYTDKVNYKGWSLPDNILLFDVTNTRPLSETNNNIVNRIQFWGWIQQSRFYQMLRRKTAINGTYAVESVEPPEYTITFDSDGGSSVASITQYYNTEVTAPVEPTKTGHTFAHWKDSDGEVTFPLNMPVDGMALTAVWTINEYTITFDSDGGSAVASITQNYNTAVTAPADPTKSGYIFGGWDVAIPTTMPAENITITAIWMMQEFIPIRTWTGTANDYIEAADYNRICNNIAVVWEKYAKIGYLRNSMRNMRCDWDINDLAMTFKGNNDNGWESMRFNIQDIYNMFPYQLMFPNAPIYPTFRPPTVSNPIERLTANLLNAMELTLNNLNNYKTMFDTYPILLTENRMRQRIIRKL